MVHLIGYEEELNCRDGFRWSPIVRTLPIGRLMRKIKDYLMLNTTDSEYPKAIIRGIPLLREN